MPSKVLCFQTAPHGQSARHRGLDLGHALPDKKGLTPAGCDGRAPSPKISTSKAGRGKSRIAGAAFHAAFSACEVNTDGGAKSRGERGSQSTHKYRNTYQTKSPNDPPVRTRYKGRRNRQAPHLGFTPPHYAAAFRANLPRCHRDAGNRIAAVPPDFRARGKWETMS